MPAIGYARVFTREERRLLGALRHGEVLVVRQLYRLGHQIEEIIRFADELKCRPHRIRRNSA